MRSVWPCVFAVGGLVQAIPDHLAVIRDEIQWVVVPHENQELVWSIPSEKESQPTISIPVDLYERNDNLKDVGTGSSRDVLALMIQDHWLSETDLTYTNHSIAQIDFGIFNSDVTADDQPSNGLAVDCQKLWTSRYSSHAQYFRGGTLRVPQAELWNYWEHLFQQYRNTLDAPLRETSTDSAETPTGSRPRLAVSDHRFGSIDPNHLKQLLKTAHQGTADLTFPLVYLDLEVDLSQIEALLQPGPSKFHVCSKIKTLDTAYYLNNGHLLPRERGMVFASSGVSEAVMRVFFEPGWTTSKTIYGKGLRSTDILALKLGGCGGRPYERAFFETHPTELVPADTLFGVSEDDDFDIIRRSGKLYRGQQSIFEINEEAPKEFDSLSEWRRAYFYLSRVKYMEHPTIRRRPRIGTKFLDESLKMNLCYYFSSVDPYGVPVGFLAWTLASTDAAEFVTLSIFFLLGLPVACMWTIGGLTLKHKRLRIRLEKIRLLQQKDEIEQKLVEYLGMKVDVPTSDDDD